MWDQIDDLDFCLAKLFLKITIFMVFFFSPRIVITKPEVLSIIS
jgi:hypothetical protein